MKLRALSERGTQAFREFLAAGAAGDAPKELLQQPDTSIEVPWQAEIENGEFKDRFEFGKSLVKALSSCDHQSISFNAGIWTWLALFFVDQICPRDKLGTRKIYKEYAYIFPQGKGVEVSRHYYRHLVRTPYVLVRQHGENAKVMLSGAPLSRRGELIEQLAARQNILGSKSAMAAAQLLYFDSKSGKFARGAAGRARPGTVDRFVGVLQQFEPTYDIHVMSGEQVVALLPKEFERWKKVSSSKS